MSLTVPQLEELQTIAETISETFPDNANNEWWAAMRILNADLGPSGPGGQPTFDATIADIRLTQSQVQPYQGRLASQSTAFREAVLQVVPGTGGGGGGGDPYFDQDFTGTTGGVRIHTINGAIDQVDEDYDVNGLTLQTGGVSKSALGSGFGSVDITGGGIALMTVGTGGAGDFNLTGLGAVEGTFIDGDETGLTLDVGSQRLSIINNLSTGLQAFDDDAAAGVGGLNTGDIYQTTGSGAAPLNAAGIVMIKQ